MIRRNFLFPIDMMLFMSKSQCTQPDIQLAIRFHWTKRNTDRSASMVTYFNICSILLFRYGTVNNIYDIVNISVDVSNEELLHLKHWKTCCHKTTFGRSYEMERDAGANVDAGNKDSYFNI